MRMNQSCGAETTRAQTGHQRLQTYGEEGTRPMTSTSYTAPIAQPIAAVQRRRTFPTQLTQWLQVQVQKRVITRALSSQDWQSYPR